MKAIVIAGAAITLFATSAMAHKLSLDSAAEAIAYRQATFSLLAANFGDLAARVQGKKPFDAAIVASRVNNVSALAQMPWEAFAVAGSDQGNSAAVSRLRILRDDSCLHPSCSLSSCISI